MDAAERDAEAWAHAVGGLALARAALDMGPPDFAACRRHAQAVADNLGDFLGERLGQAAREAFEAAMREDPSDG